MRSANGSLYAVPDGLDQQAGQPKGHAASEFTFNLDGLLGQGSLLSPEALARARLVQQQSGERLDAVITRLGLLSEQALCEHLAAASGLPLARSDMLRDPMPLERDLSGGFLRDIRAVPIASDAAQVWVAVVDPFDTFVDQAFAFAYGRRVEKVLARASDIEATIERVSQSAAQDVDLDESAQLGDMDRLRDLVSDAPAIRAVNRLIAEAVDAQASDIHLEPNEDSLTVRYRIDGLLRQMGLLPLAIRNSVVARIKVMAGLDIAEKRLPQDGRLRLAVRGHEVDLRVATAPSIHGESVVMRILDRSNLKLEFAALGLEEKLAVGFREAIHRPYGIVLVTGPTGSGKTTTLYAALAELNKVERKLLTAEDPIEYRLPGIIQTQVQPSIGFTFANALRSFLRQDPDAIMVGEIRDVETAQIAVQAALTGHMILSTLHTNTAAGAMTRLMDMEVEPFLLSSVLTGIMAQRLVRRLCLHCREPYVPEKRLLKSLGIKADVLYRPTGCTACHGTGYSGRIALFEFLPVTDTVARLILRRADAREIEDAARADGHKSLVDEGYAKAAQGLTSVEEVMRVAIGE